jgi:hypothetical protein
MEDRMGDDKDKSVIDKIVDTVKDAVSAVTDAPPPSASGGITPTYGDLYSGRHGWNGANGAPKEKGKENCEKDGHKGG